MKKTTFYLIVIFLLALGLRIFAAHNTHISTDEMIYTIIPLNIIESGVLGTVEQSPLFFFMTDIGYSLLGGITAITARLWPIIFGSMAIFLTYMFSMKIFSNRKASLLSSFLFAISGYGLIHNTEMDMMAFFFAALSIYLFNEYLRDYKNKYLYLSVISLILGVLTKIIVIVFFAIYALVYLWKKKEEKKFTLSKKELKGFVVVVGIVVLMLSPVLIYNYFSYQQTGITDYFSSVVLGIGETAHKGMEGKPWAISRVLETTSTILGKMSKWDTVMLFSGFFGIFLAFRKKKYLTSLLVGSVILLVGYVGGQTGSSSHYIWVPLVFSVFSGYAIYYFVRRFSKKHLSAVVMLVVLFSIVSSAIFVSNIYKDREQSITLVLRDYVHEEISDDAIVVIDPRIYRGIHAWVFNDKHYLEGTIFPELTQYLQESEGSATEVPIYYVECVPETFCGWKPEDFQRIAPVGEQLSQFFQSRLEPVAKINTHHKFNIYRGSIDIPAGTYDLIDQQHAFWFYPVGWHAPERAIDYYEVSGFAGLVNKFGFLVLYLEVLLSILAIPFVLNLIINFKEREI